MKRKPNKPEQEPRERPGSWKEPANPGGASSRAAGDGSPGGAGAEGTSGQSVHKSKFRQKSKQEQAAASKLRMEKRGKKLDAAKDKLAKQKPPKKPGPIRRVGRAAGGAAHGFVHSSVKMLLEYMEPLLAAKRHKRDTSTGIHKIRQASHLGI